MCVSACLGLICFPCVCMAAYLRMAEVVALHEAQPWYPSAHVFVCSLNTRFDESYMKGNSLKLHKGRAHWWVNELNDVGPILEDPIIHVWTFLTLQVKPKAGDCRKAQSNQLVSLGWLHDELVERHMFIEFLLGKKRWNLVHACQFLLDLKWLWG